MFYSKEKQLLHGTNFIFLQRSDELKMSKKDKKNVKFDSDCTICKKKLTHYYFSEQRYINIEENF
jgi:hypothetical protein